MSVILHVSQQTRHIYSMLDQCWADVVGRGPNIGPTLSICVVFAGIRINVDMFFSYGVA